MLTYHEKEIDLKIKTMWSFFVSIISYPFFSYGTKKVFDEYGVESSLLVMLIASILSTGLAYLVSLFTH